MADHPTNPEAIRAFFEAFADWAIQNPEKLGEDAPRLSCGHLEASEQAFEEQQFDEQVFVEVE
jgi:hypothetical protein